MKVRSLSSNGRFDDKQKEGEMDSLDFVSKRILIVLGLVCLALLASLALLLQAQPGIQFIGPLPLQPQLGLQLSRPLSQALDLGTGFLEFNALTAPPPTPRVGQRRCDRRPCSLQDLLIARRHLMM